MIIKFCSGSAVTSGTVEINDNEVVALLLKIFMKSCTTCNGTGKIIVTETTVYPNKPDTKEKVEIECNTCCGAGTVKRIL